MFSSTDNSKDYSLFKTLHFMQSRVPILDIGQARHLQYLLIPYAEYKERIKTGNYTKINHLQKKQTRKTEIKFPVPDLTSCTVMRYLAFLLQGLKTVLLRGL